MLTPLPPAQHQRAPLSAQHARGARRLRGFSCWITDLRCTQRTPPLPPPRGAHTHTASPAHAHGARSTHTRLGAAPAGLGEDVWAPQSRCHSFPPAFSLQLALRATGEACRTPRSLVQTLKSCLGGRNLSERSSRSRSATREALLSLRPALNRGKSRDVAGWGSGQRCWGPCEPLPPARPLASALRD